MVLLIGKAWASPTLVSHPRKFCVVDHAQTITENTENSQSLTMPQQNKRRRLQNFLICLVSSKMSRWNTRHTWNTQHRLQDTCRDHTMTDWRWIEKKDYEGGELYRLRTHRKMADWDTNNYTWQSFISQLKKLCLLHSTIQLVLYSPSMDALFNCCTSGSPHDAASMCLVINWLNYSLNYVRKFGPSQNLIKNPVYNYHMNWPG